MTLSQVFDPRHNALTAWRIILAIGVVFAHSWPLSGHEIPYDPLVQLSSEFFADGFFTISGFLITSAWIRRPNFREFWTGRTLRIFPGLWVCLLLIAFVLAPIAAHLKHAHIGLGSQIAYVLNNAVTNTFYAGIDGTPTDIPWPGVWNGAIWTLFFVIVCDFMLSILGVTGLLKMRWTIPVLFVAAVAWCAYVSYPTMAIQTFPQMLARFFVMFLAGAMFYRFQDKIPARWSLVALSVLIVAGSSFVQNYRVIAALAVAYAIIVSGALIHKKSLKHDFSYGTYIYAFPVQQFLATLGLAWLNPFLFFLLAAFTTLPLAVASWFLIEKRSIALKHRLRRKEAGDGAKSNAKATAARSVSEARTT